MSYEGYRQKLCPKGHYFEREDIGCWEDTAPCDECGEEAVWCNSVDDTNCNSYGEIDMEPFLVRRGKHTNEPDDGPDIYRIPTEEETEEAQGWRPGHGGTPLVLFSSAAPE